MTRCAITPAAPTPPRKMMMPRILRSEWSYPTSGFIAGCELCVLVSMLTHAQQQRHLRVLRRGQRRSPQVEEEEPKPQSTKADDRCDHNNQHLGSSERRRFIPPRCVEIRNDVPEQIDHPHEDHEHRQRRELVEVPL